MKQKFSKSKKIYISGLKYINVKNCRGKKELNMLFTLTFWLNEIPVKNINIAGPYPEQISCWLPSTGTQKMPLKQYILEINAFAQN